ncbi:hypothetical protein KFZ76_01935 [Methylovulum psychrotolerans]|uniref:hypothetical protein n=1 Tax=Methylovulum psychrotolerans TaxID=1704499 RepID=UPI001BFF068E|nr:hypothetical protein [Methylovulum psychrotolerans]MBT9096468.1 hypothetical protein [Methylovulum psychrotolerans]
MATPSLLSEAEGLPLTGGGAFSPDFRLYDRFYFMHVPNLYYSIIKFFIKPALNRVGNLLKTQMYRVRLLPPLMGRVGVGRIKSMAYTYGLEILIRLLSV